MPRDLTSESLTKLLKALSSDEAEAAILYTKLHDSLVRYFELKGISEPFKAADETIDRIPERIEQNTRNEEIKYIAFSVAKFVFLEKIRKEKKQSKAADNFYLSSVGTKKFVDSAEFESFRECFKNLYEQDRELLLNYFADLPSDHLPEYRQKYADREEIELNTLRNRVSRLRRRLEECVGKKK